MSGEEKAIKLICLEGHSKWELKQIKQFNGVTCLLLCFKYIAYQTKQNKPNKSPVMCNEGCVANVRVYYWFLPAGGVWPQLVCRTPSGSHAAHARPGETAEDDSTKITHNLSCHILSLSSLHWNMAQGVWWSSHTYFVHLLTPQLKEPIAAGEGKERHILMSQWRQTITEDNIIMDF